MQVSIKPLLVSDPDLPRGLRAALVGDRFEDVERRLIDGFGLTSGEVQDLLGADFGSGSGEQRKALADEQSGSPARAESRLDTTVTLRDDGAIRIRPMRRSDEPGLIEAFERLSTETRYRRFLSPKQRLGASDLRWLRELDSARHLALAATRIEAGERIVGGGPFFEWDARDSKNRPKSGWLVRARTGVWSGTGDETPDGGVVSLRALPRRPSSLPADVSP